jgi:hypothetical protein
MVKATIAVGIFQCLPASGHSVDRRLVALLHRLGLEYHKPDVIPRKLDVEKQKAFIESYDNLLNSLPDNEAVLFADAVHPTHAARPVGSGRGRCVTCRMPSCGR